MKIKTITCHEVYNHGASLQEYALLHYLNQLGHQAEAIHYKPRYLSHHFNLWSVGNPKYNKPLIKQFYVLAKLTNRLINLKRKKAFDSFHSKYIPTGKIKYTNNEELKKNLPHADAFICGSDQIWNSFFENGKDAAFYLNFVPQDKLKIAYAASFATAEITNEFKPFVKSNVANIDFVGVRESSGVQILNDLDNNNVIQVLDPIFLLDVAHWSIFISPIDEDYIFVYDFDSNPVLKEIALHLKKEKGWLIYTVSQNINYADKNYYLDGPEKMLSLTANSKINLSSSYHCIAFSLVFKKQFIAVNRNIEINTRISDLLNQMGLQKHLITTLDEYQDYTNINYLTSEAKMQDGIKRSKAFLINALATFEEFADTRLNRAVTKKKLAFLIESLELGGAEKSLVTLLNKIDLSKYEITLYLCKKGGIFHPFLPPGVHVKIIANKEFSHLQRIRYFIKKKCKPKIPHSQAFWEIFKANFYSIQEEYDYAVAYSQGFASYYVEAFLKAKMKFAWINTDYTAAGYDIRFDYPIYKNFTQVVCVSEQAKKTFELELNKIKKSINISVIKDITDIDTVNEQSTSYLIQALDKDKIQIATLGRLEKPKGIYLAIEACKILIDKGYSIEWRVLGEGSQRIALQKQIDALGLKSDFILLGANPNPYPYIKAADIYVQTSLFEGLGLSVIEAVALNKPIVSTAFSTIHEILEDEKTGLIAGMNPNDIASKIERLILDDNLRIKLRDNLALNKNNDKDITMQKIYDLLS